MENSISILRLDKSLTGQNGITVQRKPCVSYPTHAHAYYEITYYPAIKCNLIINSYTVAVKKPTVVLVTPSDFHSTVAENGEEGSVLQIAFNADILPDINILPENALLYECNGDENYLKTLLEEINANRENIKYASFIISSLILKLKMCGRSVVASVKDTKYNHVAGALRYINDHFCEDISLFSTAKELNITPQYLSNIFKQNVGFNFSKYISRLRLNYSRELLLQNKHSVSEICFLCGYRDVSHFLRSFKKEFGVSPGVYRSMQNDD